MFTYFTANNTNKYIEVLPDLLHSYNHSLHRTIGMNPADVKQEHEKKIWNRVYGLAAATGTSNKALF